MHVMCARMCACSCMHACIDMSARVHYSPPLPSVLRCVPYLSVLWCVSCCGWQGGGLHLQVLQKQVLATHSKQVLGGYNTAGGEGDRVEGLEA